MNKNRYTLFILVFLLTSIFAFSQKVDCKKFKNGEFYYPGLEGKITIRKDSIQGSYSNGNLEIMWDVIWKNDCEYDIVCTKVFNKKLPVEVGDRMEVKIVSTKKKCYSSELKMFNKIYPEGLTLPDGPYPMCLKED